MKNDFIKNEEVLEKEKKPVKKWKKILMAVVAVPLTAFFVLFIAVIAVMISDSNNQDTDYVSPTTHISERKFSFDSGADDFVETDMTPIAVRISDSKLDSFNKFLFGIKIEYDYQDVYNIDEGYERYKQSQITSVENHTHDIRVNGKIDAQVLYKRVKENNKAFLEENNLYKEYSDKKLREYCNFIAEYLPKIFKKYPQIDVDTVCCNLYELKILDSLSSLALAAVNRSNVLCINEDFQEGSKMLVDTDDVYTDTFCHELMHLCHVGCCDYGRDEGWTFGISREFNDVDVNPLAWFWIEEASAELTKSEFLNVEPITYSSKIGYLESLNFILSLRKNNNLVQLEYMNFSHDINPFFELFGATTEEEMFQVIRLMYTLESYQSAPPGFYETVLEKYGVDLNDDQAEEDFRVTVRCDILEEFSVMFYRNLAELINSGEVTLKDVYYIIRVYEADLNRHISTNVYGYMAVASEFFEKYCAIQDEFFKVLSEENNIAFEEMKTGFEKYSMNAINENSQKVSNYSLAFMSDNKINWIEEFNQKIYKKGYPSMSECINLSKQCIEEISEWEKSTVAATESTTDKN